MKAIIIAAGKATRMRPFSAVKPKGLVNVAGKAVLEHTILELSKVNPKISDVILVVGYKKEMIIKKFRNKFKGINLHYVVQEEQKGTGHALLCAKEKLLELNSLQINKADNADSEHFMVLNGDDMYSAIDLQNLATANKNCILLQKKEDVTDFGLVAVGTGGEVVDLIEKPKPNKMRTINSRLINTGAFLFSKEVFPILENLKESERGEIEMTCAVKELAREKKMFSTIVNGFWSPVSYPWNILEASKKIMENMKDAEMLHLGTVNSGAMLEGKISVDKGSTIEKGARINGRVIIGKNCKIGKNCSVFGVVSIGDGTIIKEGSIICNSIIGKKVMVGTGCQIYYSVIGDKAIIKDKVATKNIGEEKTVKIVVKEKLIDSKKEFLGAFICDEEIVSEDTSPGEIVYSN